MELQVVTSTAHLNPEPSDGARIKIEMLFGERVEILEDMGEWLRVRTLLCDYEGYTRREHFGECIEPTHRVSERTAPVYNEPYFKNPIREPLYFNSLVTVTESKTTEEGLMHKVERVGWIFASQLCDATYQAPDYVAECLKFLGTQYGYEKRGSTIDCSTLVQAGCIAAGIACPYDVKSGDMDKLGEPVEPASDLSNLKRGDLVFWTESKMEGRIASHVVIMVDGTNCLHATIEGPHRKAFIQPLAEVAADQAHFHGGSITAVQRFPDYRPI